MVLAGVGLEASLPLLLDLTLKDNNAAVFAGLWHLVEAVIVLLALLLLRRRLSPRISPRSLLTARQFWLMCVRSGPEGVELDVARRPADALRMPLVMVVGGALNNVLYAWSFQFVEAAVAAVLYQTWPLAVVVAIAWTDRIDAGYRNALDSHSHPSMRKHIALTAVATVGMVLVFLSQSEDATELFGSVLGFAPLVGVLIVLAASALTGVAIAGALLYGRALWYWTQSEAPGSGMGFIEERGMADRLRLIWLSCFSAVTSRAFLIAILLTSGFVIDGGVPALDRRGLIGLAAIGAIQATIFVVIRSVNALSVGPGVNALYYTTPVVALGILMIAGIDLPRFDLFLIGAAVILAANVMIQVTPEQAKALRSATDHH